MLIEMSGRRKYEQRERARKHEQTRQRIVDALIELHETVGAARTTVADVARRAGVGRMTVYNHFPTEAQMVTACTSHWIAMHPPPGVDAWAGVRDPDERVERALAELYRYYRDTQAMWITAHRDASLVAPLGEIMQTTWFAFLDRAVDVLAAGRALRGHRAAGVRAALRLALDFGTWRTLTSSGLDDTGAARLAAALVTTGEVLGTPPRKDQRPASARSQAAPPEAPEPPSARLPAA